MCGLMRRGEALAVDVLVVVHEYACARTRVVDEQTRDVRVLQATAEHVHAQPTELDEDLWNLLRLMAEHRAKFGRSPSGVPFVEVVALDESIRDYGRASKLVKEVRFVLTEEEELLDRPPVAA